MLIAESPPKSTNWISRAESAAKVAKGHLGSSPAQRPKVTVAPTLASTPIADRERHVAPLTIVFTFLFVKFALFFRCRILVLLVPQKKLWRAHYMMIGVGSFILQTGHHWTLSSSSLLSLSLQHAWHTPKAWKPLTIVTMFNLKKAQVALTPNRSCWTLPLWTPSHPFLPRCTNAGTPCGGTWPWRFNCRKCQILQAQRGGMIIFPKKEGGKQSTCLRA